MNKILEKIKSLRHNKRFCFSVYSFKLVGGSAMTERSDLLDKPNCAHIVAHPVP